MLSPSPSASLDSRLLLAHSCGKSYEWLFAHGEEELTEGDKKLFCLLIARRQKGEPLAHILEEKEFYGRLFHIPKGVFIPRPETELLVDLAKEWCADRQLNILDICSGSGCLAISLAKELSQSHVWASDIDPTSIACIHTNNKHYDLPLAGIKKQDLFCDEKMSYDAIFSNPPYLSHNDLEEAPIELSFEPRRALDGGESGDEVIVKILEGVESHLVPGGLLALEIGSDQKERVSTLFYEKNFEPQCIRDLAGYPRIIWGQSKS